MPSRAVARTSLAKAEPPTGSNYPGPLASGEPEYLPDQVLLVGGDDVGRARVQ